MQDCGFASVGKFANANVRFATLAMTEVGGVRTEVKRARGWGFKGVRGTLRK